MRVLLLVFLWGAAAAGTALMPRVVRMSQLYPARRVVPRTMGDNTTLLDVAKQQHLYGLLTLTDATGITHLLSMPGPLTIFAPTDTAIQDDLNPEYKMILTKNLTLLNQTLLYHMVNKKVMSSELQDNMAVPTEEGAPLRVNVFTGPSGKQNVTINGANVIKADIIASNGVIHLINSLIFPIPQYDLGTLLKVMPQMYSRLAGLVDKAGLAGQLQTDVFTMFAPTNEAFEMLPKDIMQKLDTDLDYLKKVLTYHLLQGARYPATLPLMTPGWVKTVEGSMVVVAIQGMGPMSGFVVVNDCQGQILHAVTNGVIFDMHCVLIPPPV